MKMSASDRHKLDQTDDALFYQLPRFVTHVDQGFIDQLTQLYRQYLRSGMRVLDLMSSWVSHLPAEMTFDQVCGHGLNQEELAKNPRLDHYFVQNLNQTLELPLEDESFDAVLIAVSVQYLQYPEAIFKEIQRVLCPGGVVIVSFSNRMFFQKAIQIWREARDGDRLQLVQNYINLVPGFREPIVYKNPGASFRLPWFPEPDPFYGVVALKSSSLPEPA
ncbi:class I SAM-dependent methyltransferase [Candidatus Synechococcus calcipolaris G9]|uniref:Class I SAM-dependent methyltransferase n=1 Tax=Candidatus Synechococcus calcipolaris G9 TaxID=1497997 RepID=A0ABT6F272_9SYNE|nr:class I SAM-dependent methyltransferase [Candidatus Synechococcus calcipolaris]MDG2991910.1 class I SAM-dependent methyltransferase [Candidatus Synechococcus calcipolaris G9]